MAITTRPYELPEVTSDILARLADRYDRWVGPLCQSLSERLHSQLGLRLSITNRCNLRCAYCYDRWRQPPAHPPMDMSPEFVRAVFRRIPHPKTIFVLGGEPLLNLPALQAVLETAPPRLAISTNGYLFDDRAGDLITLVRARNHSGYTTVLQVSCDLGGASMPRSSRSPSDLERKLLSLVEHASPFVKAKYTMTEADISNLRSIVRWYWERHVPIQLDFADTGYVGATDNLPLSATAQAETYKAVLELQYEGFEAFLQDEQNEWIALRMRTLTNHALAAALASINSGRPLLSVCGLLGNSIYISPDGTLHPCHRWSASEPVYEGLDADISAAQTRFHREHAERMVSGCAGCIWRGMCGWVCPAVCLLHGWQALEARCRFLGALRDAVWTFLTDPRIANHERIDHYLERLEAATPM